MKRFLILLLFVSGICFGQIDPNNTKKIIFETFAGSGGYDGFTYGNLDDEFPSFTLTQLDSIRTRNYNRLKNLLASRPYSMPGKRLEVYTTGSAITGNVSIYGVSGSKIVVYPFVPQGTATTNFFNPTYGNTYNIRNVTIKSPAKNYLSETYPCILKFSGTANLIKINSAVRPGFWSNVTPGSSLFYGWSYTVAGETKIVSSIDSLNSLIYLTTNISGAVASDTQGPTVNLGKYFPVDISITDYELYGSTWILNNFCTNNIIYTVPAATSGTDFTLNLTNVKFENSAVQVLVSMGSAKMNFNKVKFINGNTSLSFFSRNFAGGQTLTSFDTLLIENTGDLIAGTLTTAEPSGNYGAGGYLHDNVLVNLQGTLHLKNNLSASWRQYSSSYSPANPGTNYYAYIKEDGSGEYGFLMSNTMPTIIDSLVSTGQILMRYSTTINAGDITGLLSGQGTDFGIGDQAVQINNTTLRNVVNLERFKTGELNNCIYKLPLFSSIQVMISPAANLTISGGEIQNGGGVATWNPVTAGAEGSRFLYNGTTFFNNSNITIDSLSWDSYLSHYLFSNNGVQKPYYEKDSDIQLNDLDIKALALAVDGSSTAGSVSKTTTGTNVILRSNVYSTGQQGRGYVQSVSGTIGTTTKTIVVSKSYGLVGTLTNVLEIDYEHDHYETNGTINNIVAVSSIAGVAASSSNPVYGRNIRLFAVGGNITINTFDATLRPGNNIIGTNGTVILVGDSLDVTIDNDHVFQTGTSVVTPTLSVGNGVLTTFKGVLADFILDPTVIMNITAGAINVNGDVAGVFTGADVVGYVDYWTGKYEFIFTSPVPGATNIVLTYNKPNAWKNTGAWIIP